jgi:hypothetical protein
MTCNAAAHVMGIPNIVYSCQQEDTGSVRLLNAAMVNGYSIVTYQRPLKAQDELDIDILTNGTQLVIWAIGPLNSKNEVSYHSLTNKSAFRCHNFCNTTILSMTVSISKLTLIKTVNVPRAKHIWPVLVTIGTKEHWQRW